MKEVIANTAISLSKKELVTNGVLGCVEASVVALMRHLGDKFVDMILEDLKEENTYQFVLTIKPLED